MKNIQFIFIVYSEVLMADFDSNIDRNKINDISKILHQYTTQSVSLNDTEGLIRFIDNREKENERVLALAVDSGYNPDYVNESSQVKNDYYQGDEYFVKFDGFNVTIRNKTKNYVKTFNFSNLLVDMPDKEKIKFMKYIQTLPGEVLENIAVELDNLQSSAGQNMHTHSNQDFVAAGYYTPREDKIVTNPDALVHELGHAVDYRGSNNNLSTVSNNKEFKATFQRELQNYIKAGNKQYDYNDRTTWTRDNYPTANERELFAESYNLMMTGKSRYKKLILTYFPETFKLAQQIYQQIRTDEDLNRHSTPMRETLNVLKENI